MVRRSHRASSLLGVILVLFYLTGIASAESQGRASSQSITVEQGTPERPVSIRYRGTAVTTEYTKLLDRTELRDKHNNTYLFLRLSNLGSCGDSALLVTALDGKLIMYSFDGALNESPCGKWQVYKPDKVLFLTVWMDVCGLGSCRGCGPSYPIIWTVDDCRDGKIVAYRYEDLRKVYSDRDGRVEIEKMLKELHRMIVQGPIEQPLSALTDPPEKEFCARVAKNQLDGRTLELLFAIDSRVGDRFYFFDKTKGITDGPGRR